MIRTFTKLWSVVGIEKVSVNKVESSGREEDGKVASTNPWGSPISGGKSVLPRAGQLAALLFGRSFLPQIRSDRVQFSLSVGAKPPTRDTVFPRARLFSNVRNIGRVAWLYMERA
ncbi:hypothetical protein LSTR_LSTR008948 [Laodelphax striatellus]|uniref:Uncharacterized protein n=1 Tax=Laodelphax striatellus TaxID=195883 RepID=A0A482WJW4_LAOST|nr:hypothetical protein LSTR_LSTR008948 [Laodelphax striatellus]